tara:strand:+ start:6983 stop:7732 length:750 start_codon:yes stop_codon:yes gene_type:complete
MLKKYENYYHQIENEHWWHISRRDMIIKLIQWQVLDKNYRVLDIGCSTGKLVKEVLKLSKATVFGIDISEIAVKQCKKDGLKNIYLMSGDKTTFDDNSFDLIIASDCLEHIENDTKALIEWKRILKPNGKLIIFVPAWKTLWSNLDEMSHHHRRYSFSDLKNKLINTDFNIHRLSFWNAVLFIPIFIYRKIENLNRANNAIRDQSSLPSNFINELLKSILRIENNIIKKYNFPIGVSLFAICTKNNYEN